MTQRIARKCVELCVSTKVTLKVIQPTLYCGIGADRGEGGGGYQIPVNMLSIESLREQSKCYFMDG